MPVDVRGRAAVTIAQPLDAEVFVAGSWVPGAVLGWRHDEAGGCQAQVRVGQGGHRQERWVELPAVRLPERDAVPAGAAPAPAAAPPPAETVVMSRAELRGLLATGPAGRAAGRRRRHASDLTAELPAVRCADAAAAPGRHRAPAGAGRHRADDTLAGPPAADLLTRPIRVEDVAAWSRRTSAASC
ncbi:MULTISPECIES: hypothetical protein [unclassified Blastococcus]